LPVKRKSFGCLARVFLVLGLTVLILRYGWITWEWWLISLGILFYAAGLKKGGDREYLFPGTILVVFSGALLFREYNPASFPLWHVWPILFGAMGLSFLLMWLVGHSGVWVFVPGGFLMLISGGGLSSKSFVRYQLWMREIVNRLPLLLAVTIVLAAVYYWRIRYIKKIKQP